MRDKKLWLMRVSAFTIAILMLVVVEIVLQLTGVNRSFHQTYPDKLHQKDAQLIFIERPNLDITVPLYFSLVPTTSVKNKPDRLWHVQTNKYGMNDQNFDEIPRKGQIRIACLGDSCTFGWGVERKVNYASQLEKRLNEAFPFRAFEVLNCGHTGFTSFQGLKLLQNYVSAWNPEVLTFSFGMNDHTIHGVSHTDSEMFAFNHSFAGSMQRLFERSEIYALLWNYWRRYRNKRHGPVSKVHLNRVSLQEFKSNLRQMILISEKINAIPLLITQPHEIWTEEDEKYYLALMEVAKMHQVMVVDCATLFRGIMRGTNEMWRIAPGERLFLDTIHPNERGHQIIAEAIFNQIQSLDIIP